MIDRLIGMLLLADPDLCKRLLLKCYITMMFNCPLFSWCKIYRQSSTRIVLKRATAGWLKFHQDNTFLGLYPDNRAWSYILYYVFQVGRLIMAAAAKSNLKKVSLELGGKSPLVVFSDADGKWNYNFMTERIGFKKYVSIYYSDFNGN